MRIRNIAIFTAAVLAGALAGSLAGPRPAGAVAREIIDLQRDVTTLLQGQKELSDKVIQDHTVMRTLVEQSGDNVTKLGQSIFTRYLFPFEITSVLLLIAIVGAIVLTMKEKGDR